MNWLYMDLVILLSMFLVIKLENMEKVHGDTGLMSKGKEFNIEFSVVLMVSN